MLLGAQRVRLLGRTAKLTRTPQRMSQHTPRILKPKSHCLISAQRGGTNRPQVLLTSLLRTHQGGNCKSPAAIYRGRFPLQNPKSRRAGLGPSLQGHALPRSSRAGNAKIVIFFAIGFSSAGERAAGSAVCLGYGASGTSLVWMATNYVHSKVHFSPQALASCNAPPPFQPCLCPPAPSQDPPQVFPVGDSGPAMIPSSATDAHAEPRHVAQHRCRGVPVAMVCLPSRSSL